MTTEQRAVLERAMDTLTYAVAHDDLYRYTPSLQTCRELLAGLASLLATHDAALAALAVAERRAEARGKALEWLRADGVQLVEGVKSTIVGTVWRRNLQDEREFNRILARAAEVDQADLEGEEPATEDEKRLPTLKAERDAPPVETRRGFWTVGSIMEPLEKPGNEGCEP